MWEVNPLVEALATSYYRTPIPTYCQLALDDWCNSPATNGGCIDAVTARHGAAAAKFLARPADPPVPAGTTQWRCDSI